MVEYKDFNEASNSGKTFYQVMYYDRTKDYSGVKKSRYFKAESSAKNFIREMKRANENLFREMLDFYRDYGVTEDNYKDDYVWNSLIHKVDFSELNEHFRRLFRFDKDAVGYCHIDIYERNLERERIEEEEEYANMTIEEEVRIEQTQGPYGGAFADWDDYYRWKEG